MTIQLVKGDLLKQEHVDAIVNTVNCVGVMGKGIALQFRNKWPANYEAYRAACERGDVHIGKMFVFDSGGLVKPNFIINFPTKEHWRGKSQLQFIAAGLEDLTRQVRLLNIHSVAIPPLGCGNGGLEWSQVQLLIEAAFEPLRDVAVRLFEPAGAPDPRTMEVRTEKPRMTLARAAVVKALEIYRKLGYGLSRIEVQKLVYFLQEAGVPFRKVEFERDQFGPYSDALRHALERMEGHYIRGLGDGVVEAEIEPTTTALAEAEEFVATENDGRQLAKSIDRVAALIEGFQSPYGMELLSTVHWVASREPHAESATDALSAVRLWSERKAQLMQPQHVSIAWNRLSDQGWIQQERATASRHLPA
jgi:O-acetyl-ADP-ribose deacetylase (regulator of RNase III)